MLSTNEPDLHPRKKTGNGFFKDTQRANQFKQEHPEYKDVPDELSRGQFNLLKRTVAMRKKRDEGKKTTEMKTENVE